MFSFLFTSVTLIFYPNSHLHVIKGDISACIPLALSNTFCTKFNLLRLVESSGVTSRGDRVPPRDFWPGNFWWPNGKKEARKKGKRGENCEEKKENCKREGGKLKMESGKVTKWGEDFFVLFYLSVYFASFVCLFLLLTFQNHSNLFWVYQNGNFFTGKKHFMPGKKSGKMTLPPQKNFPVTPLVEL